MAVDVTAALPGGDPARFIRNEPDEALVALVLQGSEAAFEAIYDRHHRGILAFCRHMLGSREEAEDAVQHTFLSAYRALRDSEQDVALRPWLYAIARNRCLSMLRARREDDPLADAAEPSVVGLAAEVERREDLRQLLRDLHQLPDDQRAALVLAEVADLGHDEIAQVIAVPRQKVKALVFQARESLIASRRAREIPCEEIRAELATLHGGALRRSHLRRHLSECPACRGYREEIRRQRAALAVLLPVVPGVGLKRATIAAALGTGGGAAAGGAAGTAGGLAVLKGTAAKVAIGAVIAGGAVTGGVVGVRELTQSSPPPPAAGATSGSASAGPRGLNAAPAVAAAASATRRSTTTSSSAATGTAHRRAHRHRRHHHKHHSTPTSAVPAVTPAAPVAPPVAAGRVNKKPKDKVKGHGKAKGHTKHAGSTTSPPKAQPQHPQRPVTPTRTQPSTQPKQPEPSTTTPATSTSESGGTPAPGGKRGKSSGEDAPG